MGSCWGEAFFFAVFDVVGIDAIDGVEKLGILYHYVNDAHDAGGVNCQAYIMCRHDCYLSR